MWLKGTQYIKEEKPAVSWTAKQETFIWRTTSEYGESCENRRQIYFIHKTYSFIIYTHSPI